MVKTNSADFELRSLFTLGETAISLCCRRLDVPEIFVGIVAEEGKYYLPLMDMESRSLVLPGSYRL